MNNIDPKIIIDSVKELKDNFNKATPHDEILKQLKEQIKPIDFQKVAFPQIEELRKKSIELEKVLKLPDGSFNKDKSLDNERDEWKVINRKLESFKINQKHYLVLSIDHLLEFAKEKRWGLCKNHDFIYLYNGNYWASLDKEEFQKFLGETSKKMGVPKFSAKHFQFREHLQKQFLSTAYLPTPQTDNNKVLINLMNGTFEISPQKTILRAFNSKDFITYQLPFNYDPEARAPIFQKYLDEVLPDIERQKVLAEYLGFVFMKHGNKTLKEEKALVLYGSGANGKSVFYEVVNALLGEENTSNYSLSSITDEKGYHRAKLANKLVNYASEINGKLEASVFKQLVSGEPVEARLPYGQPFTLKNYAKLIFNSNELPKEVEHTNAFFRRFLIIPFDVTIPPEKRDSNLHNKIIDTELSGVFNWVLDGLNRLLEQKRFSKCDAAQKAVDNYRIESDSSQMFMDESGYKVSAVNEISLDNLYSEYANYCNNSGYKACGKRSFSSRLVNAGYQKTRKGYGMAINAEK